MKQALSFLLVLATLVGMLSVCSFSVSAANYTTDYGRYTAPSNSGDYAQWKNSRVVKAGGTTTNEVRWMQAALNYMIAYKGLNASYLNVDGSFGPASKATTTAFQRMMGLSADGSFGPATIKKMKAALGGPVSAPAVSADGSKTLNVNMSLIQAIGYQKVSGPCAAYSLAYCRSILDGKAHSYTEYYRNGACVWGLGSYNRYWGSSKANVYKAVYNSINNGRPVALHVKGNGSTGHWVAIVGYRNVTNVNSLSASNFLMIDPVKGLFKNGITPLTSGSTGYSLHGDLGYAM